jgi:hypothetical protein
MPTPEQARDHRKFGRASDRNVTGAAGAVTGETDASKGRKRADTLQVENGKLRAVRHLAFHHIETGSEVTFGGKTFILGNVSRSNQCFARVRGGTSPWVNPVELETELMEKRAIRCTHECAPYRPKFSDVVG